MGPEWNNPTCVENQKIILHKNSSNLPPRVTIGMPTYRRPDTIRRALASIADQSYREFILLVSDNAGEDPQTKEAIEDIASRIPEVCLVAQQENLGSLGNFNFLLATAKTEYFMWLADDDEITPNYLEEMVHLLDNNQTAVTAMGLWKSMCNPNEGNIRAQIHPNSKSRMARIFHFVAGEAEDSAFYGLHRTNFLRHCRFDGYFPPNRNVLTNFCYLFLFDMLLKGRFVFSQKAAWIDHNYTEKNYDRALARGVGDRIKTLLRRINVYAIYVGKTARNAPMLLPVTLSASAIGFTRDIATASWRLSTRVLKSGLPVKSGGEDR